MLIKSCAQSDLGRSRSVNEDSFLLNPEASFYLVADGMGGHGNGEVASGIAVEAIEKYLLDNPLAIRLWSSAVDRMKRHADRLRAAIRFANQEVLAEVEKDGALAGMGATVVALLIDGSDALIAHVGDSRAYRLREGTLEQITEDHTWVHEQVSAGLLSPQDARQHPFRSVVTRAVGGADDVEVEVDPIQLVPGDQLLLCSDGLNAVLSDDQIADHLKQERSLENLCQQLIDSTNDGGGPDNITVVVLEVSEGH
jgi:serine/threonine protein phosphatase PrpC